jgi:hypothetical protein
MRRRKPTAPKITKQKATEVAYMVLSGMQVLDAMIKAEVEAANARLAAEAREQRKRKTSPGAQEPGEASVMRHSLGAK